MGVGGRTTEKRWVRTNFIQGHNVLCNTSLVADTTLASSLTLFRPTYIHTAVARSAHALCDVLRGVSLFINLFI